MRLTLVRRDRSPPDDEDDDDVGFGSPSSWVVVGVVGDREDAGDPLATRVVVQRKGDVKAVKATRRSTFWIALPWIVEAPCSYFFW